jgi:hypothetical protein
VSGIRYLKSWLLKKPIQSPRLTDMSLYASGIIRIISDPALRSFDSGTMVANFAGGILEGKDKNGNYMKMQWTLKYGTKTRPMYKNVAKKIASL